MTNLQFNEAVIICSDNKVPELLLYSRGHWNGDSKYVERFHWDFRMHSSEDLGQHPTGFDTAIEALCHFTQFLIQHSSLS